MDTMHASALRQTRARPARMSVVTASGLALALALLGACALPRGAPTPYEVLGSANVAHDAPIQVVPVTRESLATLARWPQPEGLSRMNWPRNPGRPTARTIRPGDRLELAVWDSQTSSLITTEAQRVANLQAMIVPATGRVFIPYVGEVPVAGLTTDVARREIEKRLHPAVPDAQVQLTVIPGSDNTIDVVSGVARPGRIALPETSPTLLAVLAEAGGIAPTLRNPLVRLTRGGRSFTIAARTLYSDPAYDIVLQGGDRLIVEEDERSFIALGAAGRQQEIPFTQDSIDALTALSAIGGLNPSRAHLNGLMVLREYPEAAVRADGTGPEKPWVVFTFDLASAEGLFAARHFKIAPGDVVLATESPLPGIAQLIGIARNVQALQ